MKTVIVSANAKYEHENAAPWILKAACDARGGACGGVEAVIGTINDPPGHLYARVMRAAPDVAALSCHIWNRDLMLRLCADLRAANPTLFLVVGGPEVSHADGGDAFLAAGADVVLAGEGERRFPDLLERLVRKQLPDAAEREAWRHPAPSLPAECLVSPCQPEYLARLPGRIAYVEASRGCPYRCTYCLSSIRVNGRHAGLVLRPLPEVFGEVASLVSAGAKVIKFVDRTFNLSDERTLAIWTHLVSHAARPVTFHFEVAPDRLTEAQLSFLEHAPAGLFQVEAGIQSVHADTLRHIDRVMEVDKALSALKRLRACGRVHVHADLIAGLPAEDVSAFAASFDRLSAVRPHHLQMGFLKLLRGTRIYEEAEKWGYVCRAYAPYEVLASSAMSPTDLLRLKEVEETVERFRNSGRFLLILQWLEARADSPFRLYESLAELQRRRGELERAVSSDTLFRTLCRHLEETVADEGTQRTAMDLLRLDWVCAHKNPFLPEWLAVGADLFFPETNDMHAAYGEQDPREGRVAEMTKARKNRMFGLRMRMPFHVVDGLRFPQGSHAGTADCVGGESGRTLAGSSGNLPATDVNAGRMDPLWWSVLVDTREVHPVLGRPEGVCLPLENPPGEVVASVEAESVK